MTMKSDDRLRLIALALLVIIEGAAVLSAVLQIAFLPLGVVYPYVISVAVLVLPVAVGLLARRMEVAIVLAVLPFFVLAVVYAALRAPVWNTDLFQLGVLAGRVAGTSILLGALSTFGWLGRRVLTGTTSARLRT